MSDLQWSLLVVGAVAVGAVWLYNWLQERSFHRRMQKAFGAAPEDVLLKGGVESALSDGRLEPQLVPAGPQLAEDEEPLGDEHHPHGDAAESGDAVLDYVAGIEAAGAIPDAVIAELTSKAAACGKPVHIEGFDLQGGRWEDVVRGRGGRYGKLRVSMQLVNRAGAVSAAQLSALCDAVRACAERAGGAATCADAPAAMKSARELDSFCAEVDVAVGVNIIAAEGAAFPGARVRSVAESAGFRLEPDGVFHFRDERRQSLFTLDNHEPAPFLPESIKGLTTRGVTLLLDVPRVAKGAEALDLMLKTAHELAQALDGRLVDDNRAALSDAGIARIREQVRSIHARMDLRGIPAGSSRALRLFS